MATVGVLCARGRVEEKALMAALADASIVSALFPPADEPLPVGPLPVSPGGHAFPVPQIVVDRHPNRHVARVVLATCEALGVPVLSAGIAATGDRFDVAAALTAAQLPRPLTALCTSAEAALQATAALGLPATLLPLDFQSGPVALHDADTAEAVLEHRSVLGGAGGALGLVQAGSPAAGSLVTVIVVAGRATALSAAVSFAVDRVLLMAEAAAHVLRADLIAIDVALDPSGPVVWDAHPVPEFRAALPVAGRTVAAAIADTVVSRLQPAVVSELRFERSSDWTPLPRSEVRGDVVVSA